jgi:hypothetical protein
MENSNSSYSIPQLLFTVFTGLFTALRPQVLWLTKKFIKDREKEWAAGKNGISRVWKETDPIALSLADKVEDLVKKVRINLVNKVEDLVKKVRINLMNKVENLVKKVWLARSECLSAQNSQNSQISLQKRARMRYIIK